MKLTYSKLRPGAWAYPVAVTHEGDSLTVNTYKLADHGIDGGEVGPAWAGRMVSVISQVQVNINDLRALRMWSDKCVWSIHGWQPFRTGLDQVTRTMVWRNLTAETFNTKAPPGRGMVGLVREDSLEIAPFFLHVPFAGSPLSECGIHVLTYEDQIPHLLNGQAVAQELHPEIARELIMPKVGITGPASVAPGALAEFVVRVVDADGQPATSPCEIYLECVNGYLPKNRLTAVNGLATGKIMALGLTAGDTMEVRVGWKYFTNDARLTIEVV